MFDAADLIAGDCLPFPAPPPPPQPPPPAPVTTTVPGPTVTTTNTVTTTAPAPSPQPQGGPALPVVPTPPTDERGFATPKVKLAGTGLSVTVANTTGQPIHVGVTATAKAGRRTVRFGGASATLAAGQARTLSLRAPHRVHGRITDPVVTVRNLDTGGTVTLRPRA